jgi:hypothetical protein
MGFARTHNDSMLDDPDIRIFERQRVHRLELTVAILLAVMTIAALAAHFIGRGMPNPYFG